MAKKGEIIYYIQKGGRLNNRKSKNNCQSAQQTHKHNMARGNEVVTPKNVYNTHGKQHNSPHMSEKITGRKYDTGKIISLTN